MLTNASENLSIDVDMGEDAGAGVVTGSMVGWPQYGNPSMLESSSTNMALVALMDRTGYNMLQVNRQRANCGPPPGWDGPPPPHGCEVFVSNIPRDMYEDELVPLFERAGQIYEFRLMLEFSGQNRGYGFAKFSTRDEAHRAIQELDNFEVRPGKFISVCSSVDNCRLFISPIPRDEIRDNILEGIKMVTEGVEDVVVPLSNSEGGRNRGFAFIEYKSHKAAALARRRLVTVQPWGHPIRVKWAELETVKDWEPPHPVRVLYVCNLQPQTSEETLKKEFSSFNPGCVERVKKFISYAFIHYRCHREAMIALNLMNGAHVDGVAVEVRLARDRTAAKRVSGELSHSRREGGEEVGGEHLDQDLPGTPLSPTSLLSVNHSQISSAVTLLEYYCMKRSWSPPEYKLFYTDEPKGDLLLAYNVLVPFLQATFMSDTLCQLVEDAKELAAKTSLWHLMKEENVRRGGGVQESSRGYGLLQIGMGNPINDVTETEEHSDQGLVRLLPTTPLYYTSLLSVNLSQISSAVTLLEYYCMKRSWSPPEYKLFYKQEPNRDLLVYEVVVPGPQKKFMPDTLCKLVEEAKELAAKTALWNLEGEATRRQTVQEASCS